MAHTPYVILRFNPDTDEWAEHGDRVTAGSSESAISQHVRSFTAAPDGTFVAVPARSWKPAQVHVLQVPQVKLTLVPPAP